MRSPAKLPDGFTVIRDEETHKFQAYQRQGEAWVPVHGAIARTRRIHAVADAWKAAGYMPPWLDASAGKPATNKRKRS
jgi:hypothetical protein